MQLTLALVSFIGFPMLVIGIGIMFEMELADAWIWVLVASGLCTAVLVFVRLSRHGVLLREEGIDIIRGRKTLRLEREVICRVEITALWPHPRIELASGDVVSVWSLLQTLTPKPEQFAFFGWFKSNGIPVENADRLSRYRGLELLRETHSNTARPADGAGGH